MLIYWTQRVVNDSEEYTAVLEGVESIAQLIYRYVIFENVYLGGEHPAEGNPKEGLKKTLKNMYEAILLYLFKAKKYHSKTVPRMSRFYHVKMKLQKTLC